MTIPVTYGDIGNLKVVPCKGYSESYSFEFTAKGELWGPVCAGNWTAHREPLVLRFIAIGWWDLRDLALRHGLLEPVPGDPYSYRIPNQETT